MSVTIKNPNMVHLEYKHLEGDVPHGGCRVARFSFNLDRYELSIISDCGEYGHKWIETPDTETFMELMSRINKDYFIRAVHGHEDIFDFEATRDSFLAWAKDEYDWQERYDELVDFFKDTCTCPDDPRDFVDAVARSFPEFDAYEIWGFITKVYSPNILALADVFEAEIQPFIKQHFLQEDVSHGI